MAWLQVAADLKVAAEDLALPGPRFGKLDSARKQKLMMKTGRDGDLTRQLEQHDRDCFRLLARPSTGREIFRILCNRKVVNAVQVTVMT